MELRRALDQLSASYADARQQLAERDAAITALTASLAIARTESELFQKLWTDAQVRAQRLGADLTGADAIAQHAQFVESLRALHVVEAERQRLMNQLQRLIAAVTSNVNVLAEVQSSRQLLTAAPQPPVGDKGAPLSSLELTRVLDVNENLRLAVLDVGAQHGARVGMPMLVWRGDRVVATLRIVEVRQKICGAVMEQVENNITLQAGDSARVTKS